VRTAHDLRAVLTVTCPGCDLPLRTVTADVVLDPDSGRPIVGTADGDRALALHLRTGCTGVCRREEGVRR
jgi:hypothetical protein